MQKQVNKTYSDAKRQLQSQISFYNAECDRLAEARRRAIADECPAWFVDMLDEQRQESYKKYRLLKSRLGAKQGDHQSKVATAKTVRPIDIIPADWKLLRNKIVCPIHNEKTPSCQLYDDHYYCFGCNEGGDTISLYQKIYNVGFKEAVNALYDLQGA